jgi:hypothetical protein
MNSQLVDQFIIGFEHLATYFYRFVSRLAAWMTPTAS